MPTEQPDWVNRHLNQDFPPRLPEGWSHPAPFAIARSVDTRHIKLVASVRGLDNPPFYLVETKGIFQERVYLAQDGSRHVGVGHYKCYQPPGTYDFEEAVRLAEAYLDRSLPVGPVVEHPRPSQ